MITINLENDDWVWLCEFLVEVIKDGDLDLFDQEDMAHLINTLKDAEKGVAK